mmetsp:Transcript_20166/g.52460  ORF Transcript_20166/g.52460 Transcript_20166/m.52460 type:complete len:366 (-) Transcript_20166:205-1302(-)
MFARDFTQPQEGSKAQAHNSRIRPSARNQTRGGESRGKGLGGTLVEQREAHVLLLRLLLGGLLLGWLSSSRGCRGGSSCSKGLRVGQDILNLLGQREGVVGGQGQTQHVLVAVDDGVGDGGQGGAVGGQGQGSHVGDTGRHRLEHVLVGDVQHGGVVQGVVLKHLLDLQAILEGLDAQLGQQGGLGGTHALALLHQLHVVHHLNGTLGNLGGNTQGLEEGGLGGIHTGGPSRHVHVAGSNQVHAGRGADLVLVDLLLHVVQVTIGENDAHVVDQVVQDDPPLVVARGLAVHLDGALHHGVLAHQDDSIRAQGPADLLELHGANVVGAHDEGLVIGVQELAHLLVVCLLLGNLRGSWHGFCCLLVE